MKIKQNHSLMIFFILLLFYGSLFSQNRGLLLLDLQENQLKERLQLTPEQVNSVKEIIKMLRGQASLDRQNFKENAHALVAAAVRRAQMAESRLAAGLDNTQKAALMKIKKEQKKDREFFSLKQGLILTVEQAAKVKLILQRYDAQRNVRGDAYDNMGDLMGPMSYGYGMPGMMRGNMPPGARPGTMQRNMPGTMQGNMQGTMRPNAMRINERLIEKLRNLEAEKEKAVEPLLNPEQKKLFKQLKEARHKEFEILLQKIRENRTS